MVKDSIFRPIYDRQEKRIHKGYDYRNKILKNSISSQLIGVSPLFDGYIAKLELVIYEWVESVKQIKIFVNPALDKYENKIR